MLWNKLKNLKSLVYKEEKELLPEQKYLSESYDNFVLHYNDPKKALLKDINNIKNGKLPKSERDFIWMFFLGIIPFKHPENWQKILTEERAKYLIFKKKFVTKDIEDFIELKRINDTYKYDGYKNILSKEDFELLNLIKVDADRTYQEKEIFLKEEIKKTLIYVLFIHAKENPKYGYRQGMNDICGILLYVLYKDFELNDEFEKDTLSCTYSIIHSNNHFLEHDLFLLYSKFMSKGISDFFLYTAPQYKKSFLSSKSSNDIKELTMEDIYKCNDSELKRRIYLFYYKIFYELDSEFYEFLDGKLEPELFLTRWYLCVFSREFKLEQILYLWDLIILYEFVESKLYKNKKLMWHYNFMDCIALSMLLNCKSLVLKNEDANEVMSYIMHYPPDISIEKISKKALEIYLKVNPEINI